MATPTSAMLLRFARLLMLPFVLTSGMTTVKELSLYLQNWPSSISRPRLPLTKYFSKTFCPCLSSYPKKSTLSIFIFSLRRLHQHVQHAESHLAGMSTQKQFRQHQNAFLVSMSYVTQVQICLIFALDWRYK